MKKYFWGVQPERCVRLTTSQPSVEPTVEIIWDSHHSSNLVDSTAIHEDCLPFLVLYFSL
jgi:hypothetical protein